VVGRSEAEREGRVDGAWELEWRSTREEEEDCMGAVWLGGGCAVVVSDGGYDRWVGKTEDVKERDRVGGTYGGAFCLGQKCSGGWVMGMCENKEEDGAGTKTIPWVVKGGGRLRQSSGAGGSSYRSELFGMVCYLRLLTSYVKSCKERGVKAVAGPIHHWTDNESIALAMREYEGVKERVWRERKSRDLWAEIRRRLAMWAALGGSWSTSWVKGHVDEDKKRAVSSWTAAEKLNMEADRWATKMLEGVRGGGIDSKPGWEYDGAWRGLERREGKWGWARWQDNVGATISQRAALRSFTQYWENRVRAREGSGAEAVEEKGIMAPCIDIRTVDTRRGRARNRMGIFQSKLWWDHLPSMAVRNRGVGLVAGEERKCDLCGEVGEGSTWHILAKCTMKELQEEREKGQRAIMAEIDRQFQKGGRVGTRDSWERAFRMEKGQWLDEELRELETCKAGDYFNPWYGLFPPEWLDRIHREGTGGRREWERAVVGLRQLGQVVIMACYHVWVAAGKLWGDKERAAK